MNNISISSSLQLDFEWWIKIINHSVNRIIFDEYSVEIFSDPSTNGRAVACAGKTASDIWFEGFSEKLKHINYLELLEAFMSIKPAKCESDLRTNGSVAAKDIIKYAYDLLTNFKGEPIIVNVEENKDNIRSSSTTYELSIRKPEYVAESCVFENGWDNIKSLHLFEHFLVETLQSFSFDALSRAPEDSRMLLIAMVYFSRKRKEDVTSEIYSIMLSYVMLNIVGEKVSIPNAGEVPEIEEQPTLDATMDKDHVSLQDCEIAASIMKEYFVVDWEELQKSLDDIFKQLIEFQGCLEELNRLNTLCGTSFPPTVYSKTYNGTFVYKVLRDMQRYDAKEFISRKLNPAPTVLAFVEAMLEVYRRVMYEY